MVNNDTVLAMYLKDINKVPLLTREEELSLATLAAQGDKIAKNKMVNANLRFVVNVAKKYQNHGLDLTDLISEGNIGLLTAIEKFDVSKGYNSCAYLARIVKTSDELSEADEAMAIESAIDEIIKMNVLGIYKKVQAYN